MAPFTLSRPVSFLSPVFFVSPVTSLASLFLISLISSLRLAMSLTLLITAPTNGHARHEIPCRPSANPELSDTAGQVLCCWDVEGFHDGPETQPLDAGEPNERIPNKCPE